MKLEDRTPSQQEAILTKQPCVLAVAGPGAGKTATTIARIHHLIEDGVAPSTIVVITFTNAAAREIENRIEIDEHEPYQDALGYIGTLHGFALRMLKQYGGKFGYGDRMSIISPESAQDLLVSKAEALGCKLKIDELQKLKAKGRPPKTRLDLPQTVIASYYQDLQDAGIVDFDILLTEFAALIDTPALGDAKMHERFQYLFVDEVQDSGPVDWEIYLGLPIANKFYVGDPDQAIYGFRGGDLHGMMWLAKKPFTHLIHLEENFRSHTEVCTAAQHLIEHNRDRLPKVTTSVKGPGGTVLVRPPFQNEGEELAAVIRAITDYVKNDDPLMRGENIDEVAVLCRTNAMAFEYVKGLEAAGLPVVKREKSTLPKDWPLTRALVELMANPENDTLAYFYLSAFFQQKGASPKEAASAAEACRRAANSVGKSLNRANVGLLAPASAAAALGAAIMKEISLESRMHLAAIVQTIGGEAPITELVVALGLRQEVVKEEKTPGIHVLTIHGSKGREFDAVFLVGWEDEIIPGKSAGPAELEEERRLAYVAITRARDYVLITSAMNRKTPWGAIANHQPSRFTFELA